MVVAKIQGTEKPAKIEQRKVQGPEWGRQVEQKAVLASLIYIGQTWEGRKKHIKRGIKRQGVSLPCLHALSVSLSPSLSLSLSSLCVFWFGMPSHLEDVFSLYFLNKTELLHRAVTLICPRAIIRSVQELRAVTWTVQELWRAEGFNIRRFKFLLWWDRTEEITCSPHIYVALTPI